MSWIKIFSAGIWNIQGTTLSKVSIGAGIVARNHDGHLILAKLICSPDVMNPTLAEAITVKEALIWAMEMGWSSVTIESDYMVVIQLIRSSTPMRSRLGMLILEEVIGLTTKDANELAFSSSSSKCVYIAGCVTVVYDVESGKHSYLLVSHQTPKPLTVVVVSPYGNFVAAGR
ncbi:hypothetical protein AgCh_018296 [Apium graveolens]